MKFNEKEFKFMESMQSIRVKIDILNDKINRFKIIFSIDKKIQRIHFLRGFLYGYLTAFVIVAFLFLIYTY